MDQMKRFFALFIAALLALPGAWALAEDAAARLDALTVVELASGDALDLDGDGAEEAVRLTVMRSQATGMDAYTLSVGAAQIGGSGDAMTGRIFAARLGGARDVAYLLLSDYGPSDDDTSYVYRYEAGGLAYVGTVPAMPENFILHDGYFSARTRGRVLHTWYREGDFVLARTTGMTNDGNYSEQYEYAIAAMPRAYYPMGTIVTALVDIPLVRTQADGEIALTVAAGERVALVATDDVKWVCVAPLDASLHDWEACGWLELGGYGYECLVDGEPMDAWAVFDGLMMAD